MTLEELKTNIAADTKQINKLRLIDESSTSTSLFGKYINIYGDEKLKFLALWKNYNKMYKLRRDFYIGNASDEVYKEEPQDRRILRAEVDIYLKADEKLQDIKDKIDVQEIIIEMLEKMLKDISQRSYSIRNMVEMTKFENGG
jgi:hypothetical protein